MKKCYHILLSKRVRLCFVICLIFYLFLYLFLEKTSLYAVDDSFFSGVVSDYEIDGEALSFTLSGKEDLVVFYRIKSEEEKNNLLVHFGYGYQVEVHGTLNIPNQNTIPNTFNYRKYLYYKHIFYTLDSEEIKIVSEPNIWYQIKNKITSYIKKTVNSAYLLAFILGDTTYLDEDILRANGISHLFAVSGMHISLFVSFVDVIGKRSKKSKFFLIFFLFFYAFLVGFTASVLRVVLMYYLKIINEKFHLFHSGREQLIFVMILLLLIDPFWIMDIGFQYSFSICFYLTYLKTSNQYFIDLIKVSILAFLVSIPITAINFYEVNLLSILFNLFFVPFVSFLLYPCCLFSFILPFFNRITSILIDIFEIVNSLSYHFSFGRICFPKIFFGWWVLYYFFLFFFYKKQLKTFLYLSLLFLALVKISSKLTFDYQVIFLDVGQGDAMAIISPFQKNVILIDTGGKIKYSKEKWQEKKDVSTLSDSIITYFHSIGISKIDAMILTHGDYDHMGEALNLVVDFNVKQVIFNCGEFNELEQNLIKVLDKKKIPYYSCIKELNIDDNKLYFLNNNDYGNENDNSSVIYAELNNHKFLFMGDAGVTTEKEILEKYNLPKIDVLKVGHHGSKTSSSETFIDSINPKHSIISVGKNNRYGHPNKEVLNVLENSKIYRTDKQGSILFKIKSDRLKIEMCAP